jgi:(+)-trans-carveol dehydrogenase
MTGRVQGKVALITGGGRGQGRSHALKLAAEGADIVAFDICHDLKSVAYDLATPDDLKQTVAEVEALDRRALGIQGDVRDLSALTDAVKATIDTFGQLDIVCANAGIAGFVPGLGMEGWAESTPGCCTTTASTPGSGPTWRTRPGRTSCRRSPPCS